MIRTQVYLEESASKALHSIALQTGKKQSELIREAIDKLIDAVQDNNPKIRLQKAKGIWKDRHDLIDIEDLRSEWDRR
jgi:hypothetical protein